MPEFLAAAAMMECGQTGLACLRKYFARVVHVFITTTPFQPDQAQYANGDRSVPADAYACTPDLLRAALDGLVEIYRPGYPYKKAGVMLPEIIPDSPVQTDLFIPP